MSLPRAIDCWVNPSLGVTPDQNADYLFPGLSERWTRGTTLSQLLQEMDASGIEKAILVSGYGPDSLGWVKDAVIRHPDRLAASHVIDPRDGMKAVRLIDDLVRNHGFRLIRLMAFMAQKGYDDAIYYPVYAKCAELGVPVSVNVGIPGPRVPSKCQDPFALDEVCSFFPELKIVMAHGGEPWPDMCVKLMLKWPNLFYMTSAFAPKYVPAPILAYLNSRGKERVMWASDYPNLTFDRCMKELAALSIRDASTLENFLAGNARRLFFPEAMAH